MGTRELAVEASEKRTGRAANVVLWSVQVLLAANFVFVGGAKLGGMEQMVATFDGIGIGHWFRYLTGAIELGGGLLLLIPGLAVIGAISLSVVMVGAVVFEVFVLSGSVVPPLVLLLLLSVVVYGRRGNLQV